MAGDGKLRQRARARQEKVRGRWRLHGGGGSSSKVAVIGWPVGEGERTNPLSVSALYLRKAPLPEQAQAGS